MMQLIDGRTLAKAIQTNLAVRVAHLRGSRPGLAIILVGDDPASHTYVAKKEQACKEVGMTFEKFLYPTDTSTQAIVEKVRELNGRADIHGILVQLPLPAQNEQVVIDAIDSHKDVDGFHRVNQERLEKGEPCLAPATALGIMKLIESTGVDVRGLNAGVVGSDLFTRPLGFLLSERGVTTERIDPNASNLSELACQKDILITVVGRPGLIQADAIKDGAIVTDVGTTRVNGNLLGDVDPHVINQKTGWLTPVPGGVGPMTVRSEEHTSQLQSQFH